MKLTQEQVEKLKNLYATKIEESNKMREMVSSTSRPIVCDSVHTGDSVDNLIRTEQANLNAQISFIESILKSYTIAEVIDDGRVHVGTTFAATIDFGERKDKIIRTLVEKLLPYDSSEEVISLDSPIGKNILEKSVGETFNYSINERNRKVNKITVTIEEIIKTKKHTR